jgi:hypothetical protein
VIAADMSWPLSPDEIELMKMLLRRALQSDSARPDTAEKLKVRKLLLKLERLSPGAASRDVSSE